MEKHRAHDIVHTFHGGMASNCPFCQGTMDEKEMKNYAEEIAQDHFKPSVNPNLPYDQRMAMQMAEIKSRASMPDSDFAYVDSKGGKHLPINDANHVRAALSRFNQTHFDSEAEKKAAWTKIDKKADDLGIEHKDAYNDHDEDNKTTAKEASMLIEVMHFAEDGAVPEKIKIVPIGDYKTQAYGDIKITGDMISEMKKHFDEGIRAGGKEAGLPIDIEHGESSHKGASAGWIKEMFAEKDGLYAKVEWTDLGRDLLQKKIYKFYSPEIHFQYVDPENSSEYSNVITGGGLVNKPMFKHDLYALVASEKNLTESGITLMIFVEQKKTPMKLSEILAKEKSTRTADETAFMESHKDELTVAQAKAEGFLKDEKIIAAEGQVVMTAAEKKSLEAAAAQGVVAFEQLKRAGIEKEVSALVFNEKGGKIAPANVKAIVDLMVKMSEEDRKEFKAVLDALPEKKIFGEVGNDAAATKGQLTDILTVEAKKLQAADASKKMTFAEAVSKVLAAKPELAEYQEERTVAVTPR